jgi:hypothetical protein
MNENAYRTYDAPFDHFLRHDETYVLRTKPKRAPPFPLLYMLPNATMPGRYYSLFELPENMLNDVPYLSHI